MKPLPMFMVGIMSLALSACASRQSGELYTLSPPHHQTQCGAANRTLVIARPLARHQHDGTRIVVMLDRHHPSFYAGASWASPFPDQLQDFMTEAFKQRGLDVVEDHDAATANTILKITIHDASITDLSAPTVNLKLSGTVTNPYTQRLSRFRVHERIMASQNHMPQIIEAYRAAAANAVQTISKAMKLQCS